MNEEYHRFARIMTVNECLACKRKLDRTWLTTIYCPSCELDGRANLSRHALANKEEEERKNA